ncbi:unnamed protein product [Schistosoma curassoni]|uniref:SIX1_SD domain-containing protein n=1 Tax=Schistosoma curassoni TaxID=6186 RepID=A0A183KQM9_9TREM|nr:unnamed protein product [Schistosoma curassoni]
MILRYNTAYNYRITLDGEDLENVKTFTYLGGIIDENGGFDADVKAWIDEARAAYLQLKNIWNSKQLSTKIKMFLSGGYSALALPIHAFTSASDPPYSSVMLPRYVKVGCICEVLIRSNQIITLRHLLNRIPKIWLIPEEHFTFYYYQQLNKQSNSLTIDNLFESREIIIKALAIVSYEDQNYKLVYQLLQCNHFNERHQAILQQLWYKTHYAEVQNSRDRPLTAVDKYRIRKKYPLPKTIWDGVQTVYCFKQNVRHILIQYYQQNKYPNSREKYEISIKTGLTFTQVLMISQMLSSHDNIRSSN